MVGVLKHDSMAGLVFQAKYELFFGLFMLIQDPPYSPQHMYGACVSPVFRRPFCIFGHTYVQFESTM